MRHLLASTVLAVTLASPVVAEGSRTLVELFTSQGCSSCPPADALLAELAARDDVLALSLHVDYWDYLGWKDDLADPAYTARQKGYAHEWSARQIYTPQIVVNGRTPVVGSKPGKVLSAVDTAQAAPVAFDLARGDGGVQVVARALGTLPDQLTIHVVHYTPRVERDIEGGENSGRSVTYHNVVTDWTVAGQWNTFAPLDRVLPVQPDGAVAVILQDGASGPVIAAAAIP